MYHNCTGGATVKLCVQKIKHNKSLFQKARVFLMVGLNDVLKGTRSDYAARDFKILLRMLQERECNVVVMLLPPVPRFQPGSRQELYREWLNCHMQSTAESMNIRVINADTIFRRWDGSVKSEFFERFMGAERRPDNIHWNEKGMKALVHFLKKCKEMLARYHHIQGLNII
ncbi:uncharacterized protein LOC134544114 isoform X1 [Bacillus rossius redtenbacheri]|uniref:uncharacterized protein LOC134544114 isoform X1 n=2 Tax=Bacillus rossius redtenbacheri TaxID=93214 RepID=UPI002FDCC86C